MQTNFDKIPGFSWLFEESSLETIFRQKFPAFLWHLLFWFTQFFECEFALLDDSKHDQRVLFQTVDRLLHTKSDPLYPTSSSDNDLANEFADFFTEKITSLQNSLDSSSVLWYILRIPLMQAVCSRISRMLLKLKCLGWLLVLLSSLALWILLLLLFWRNAGQCFCLWWPRLSTSLLTLLWCLTVLKCT